MFWVLKSRFNETEAGFFDYPNICNKTRGKENIYNFSWVFFVILSHDYSSLKFAALCMYYYRMGLNIVDI